MQLPSLSLMRKTPSGLVPRGEADTETKLLVQEAQALGIDCELIPDTNMLKLVFGTHTEYLRNRAPSTNRTPGPRICANKKTTRTMLDLAGISITPGYDILKTDTASYRKEVFEALKKPLVVKPANSTHGQGVKMGIESFDEMNDWLNHLFSTVEIGSELVPGQVLVEETATGEEYRVIATENTLLAVMLRKPASVIGDGVSSIQELITAKNAEEVRNISQDLYPHIHVDDDLIDNLNTVHLTLASIPQKDEVIRLRQVSNIMAGGDAVDITDEVHPSLHALATKIVRAIPGMTFLGIDFMTQDIFSDQNTTPYAVIEVNSAPEFAMHDIPMIGKKRFVAKEMLLLMFPELKK